MRRVATSIGAECAGLYDDEQYHLLESARHDGLPHLLVDYLRAYARDVLGQ